MSPTPPPVLEALRRQHGLISRSQAIELGITPAAIRHLRTTQRWETVLAGVYGIPGHRPTWLRQLWSAWLHAGPGSVVSHEAAGRRHRFEEVEAGGVDLIVPGRRRHPPPGVRWHRLEDLGPSDVVVLDGLPTTSPVRTVVDLAGTLHIARLRLLVEHGIVERRFSLAALGSTLARVRRKGKPGVRRLTTVLDDLGPGRAIPNGELEKLLDPVIGLSGLEPPVHEYPLPGGGAVEGFVDRCWPAVCLIVEADGRRWHERRQQQVRDNERTLRAQASGYETVCFMWEQLRHDPAGSAELLRTIHDRRARLLGYAPP